VEPITGKELMKQDDVIVVRLPHLEAEVIRAAADREQRSINQWCRLALAKAIKEIK
jgi:hypothetical protein